MSQGAVVWISQQWAKAANEKKLDLLWLLGADEIDFNAFSSCYIIYQGHHGDAGAHHADLVLPGRLTPKKTVYTSILRVVFNTPVGPRFRPVKRVKIGQLSALFRELLENPLALTPWRNCVKLYVRCLSAFCRY